MNTNEFPRGLSDYGKKAGLAMMAALDDVQRLAVKINI